MRESHRTAAGPRTRTLVAFTSLDDDVIRRAQSRARGHLEKLDVRRAAAKAGAPVAPSAADAAAIGLFEALQNGDSPRPALWRLMAEHVPRGLQPLSAEGRAAAEWLSSTPEQRGEALVDLLSLADALPQRRRRSQLRFPRLESR